MDPGQIEQSVQQPIELAVPPPLSLPPKPSLTRPKNVDQYSVDLKSIELTGANAVDADDLGQVYQDRIGSSATLGEIYDIADRLPAMYRRKGFVLSQAIAPAQKIEDGMVQIQIIEGL